MVGHDAALPAVCLKCGTHDAMTMRPTTFYWTPPWARWLMFCGVGLLVALVVRKEADLEVPLCTSCNARWTSARYVMLVAAALIACAIVGLRIERSTLAIAGLVVAVAVFAFVVIAFARPRMLRVKRIDAEHAIHLRDFDASAAKEIVEGSR